MNTVKTLMTAFLATVVSTFAMATIEGSGNLSYATRGIQTQAVYYRDASFDQPLIGAKMEFHSSFTTMPFLGINIQLSDATDPSILSDFKLYKTSVNYFAPVRATELKGAVSIDGRSIAFRWDWSSYPQISNGDYIWVTARVKYDSPAAAEIDAKIKSITVNGYFCVVENEDPVGRGRTYEFRRHVVPYYRMKRTGNWNDAYYGIVSEVVFFYMGVNNNGNLYYGWEGGQFDEDSFRASLETLRDGRPKGSPVRIMLGLAHCAPGLSAATQNNETRANLVNQIVHYVEKFGFDGVDIDWEYPESNGDWEGFEKLVADLRPRLFALDNGQMVSSAMSNYKLWQNTDTLVGLHQQLDFFNTMTYDNGSSDGHSPWWLHNESKYLTTSVLGLPPIKANIGVPFYTDSHRQSDGTLTWEQMGYEWVYGSYPQYVDAIDIFYRDDRCVTEYGEDDTSWPTPGYYSYNSIKTIREKGADLRKGGYGVMIWGYECDIGYDNPKSLARALASTIRPTDAEVKSVEDWGNMTDGVYVLTTDLVLDANSARPNGFTGTLDGQGHTITLKGGSAAIPGGFEGLLMNVTIVVEGNISANGAVADTLQGCGLIDNVTVIVKEGVTISGESSAGAVVGDIWASAKGYSACVKNCTAEIYGTLTSSRYGRVGGVVGNMNLGYTLEEGETEPVRIQGCRAELYPTAKLYAPATTTHCGVGGLFGNGNTTRECARDNTVVIYKGATLEAQARVGGITGGNTNGYSLVNLSNNWAIVEKGVGYGLDYADHIMDFTIGEPDRATKTAMVEYYSRTDGVSFRIRQAVQFTSSGYFLRLR